MADLFLRKLTRGFPGILYLALAFSWAYADSTLNSPRLSFDPSTVVGIAIVNPTDEDAEVLFTAYAENGELQDGLIRNPASLLVPANQQLSLPAKDVDQLFGPGPGTDTVGWFQATSPTDGLVGFFLFVNGIVTEFDGAGLPVSARDLVFTQIRNDSGYSTELNLVCPGSTGANLTLTLFNPPAAPVSVNLSLASRGAARRLVADLFGVSNIASDAFIQVSADAPVAGFQFVRAPNGDLVGLNARRGDERLTHLYFPQIVFGIDTTLGLVNNSSQAVVLTLTAFKTDGSQFGSEDLQENPINLALDPTTARTVDLQSAFGYLGSGLQGGWLQVKSTLPAVTGYLTYGEPAKGYAATVAPIRAGQDRAIFSHIQTTVGFFTGMAVINPGQLAVDLTLLAITAEGEVRGSLTKVLPPGAQFSALIGTTEFIPNADGLSGGLIFMTSNLPVYATSLFGDFDQKVLATIPPQVAPADYEPDAGVEVIEVTPTLAVLQPSQSQAFQAQGAESGPVWKVNDVEGGDATIGTVTADGVYTAPPEVPLPRVVTISAEVGAQSGGASVDVLEKEQLLTSQLIVQSVAYLSSLQRLYSAELALLGASAKASGDSGRAPAQAVERSEIYETSGPGLPRSQLAAFDNDAIAKMVAYPASNGNEFLLLVGQTSGTLIRLDPETGGSTVVASGFDSPNAAVVDRSSGDVLVADANEVRIVQRSEVEAGLVVAARTTPGPRGEQAASFIDVLGGFGIAVDECTGDVYLTDEQLGTLSRFSAREQRVQQVFDGLLGPAQILAIYRRGVSCPDAFQLLVVEAEANRLSLATPARGLINSWLDARAATDVTFIPGNTPFAETSAILLTEQLEAETQQTGSGFSVQSIGVPGLVDPVPENGILRDAAQVSELIGNASILYPSEGEVFTIAEGETVFPVAVVATIDGSFGYQALDGQAITVRAGLNLPSLAFDEGCTVEDPSAQAEIVFEVGMEDSSYQGMFLVPNNEARQGVLTHPCLDTPVTFEIDPDLAAILNLVPLPNGRVFSNGTGEYKFFGDLPGGTTGTFMIPPFDDLLGVLPVGGISLFPAGHYTVQLELRIQQQLIGRESVTFTVEPAPPPGMGSGDDPPPPPPSPSGQGTGTGERSAIPYGHLLLLFSVVSVVAARLRR